MTTDTPWQKATASDTHGSCVEQRRHDGVVEVRDTKDNGTGPVLRFFPLSTRRGSMERSVVSSTT